MKLRTLENTEMIGEMIEEIIEKEYLIKIIHEATFEKTNTRVSTTLPNNNMINPQTKIKGKLKQIKDNNKPANLYMISHIIKKLKRVKALKQYINQVISKNQRITVDQ